MDPNASDYCLGSQTLREIELQENAVLNRPITEVIEGSQQLISEETPKNSSIQHKSLSDRFRLATQKQISKKKFEKSRSNSSMTLSRMIQNEVENIDFNAW